MCKHECMHEGYYDKHANKIRDYAERYQHKTNHITPAIDTKLPSHTIQTQRMARLAKTMIKSGNLKGVSTINAEYRPCTTQASYCQGLLKVFENSIFHIPETPWL